MTSYNLWTPQAAAFGSPSSPVPTPAKIRKADSTVTAENLQSIPAVPTMWVGAQSAPNASGSVSTPGHVQGVATPLGNSAAPSLLSLIHI